MSDSQRFSIRLSLTISILLSLQLSMSSFAEAPGDRHLRPMSKTEVPEIGLIIWTELEPQWIIDRSSMNGRIVLTAQTPIATSPPAAFTFTSFKELVIASEELKSVAQKVAISAKSNYRSTQKDEHFMNMYVKSYGALTGYEVTFDGLANGEEVSVKVFLGQSDNMPPVLLQAYTLRGKLQAISENIRRSWSNVAYIEPVAKSVDRLGEHSELTPSTTSW